MGSVNRRGETLDSPLRRAMQVAPDRIAVIDGSQRFTYRDVYRRTTALSGGLRRLGLQSGDVVAALALNSFRHFELWLCVPTSNLVLTDLNIRLAVEELEFIVNDCGARMLVTDRQFLDTASELLTCCPSLSTLVFADDGEPADGSIHWDELCESQAGASNVSDIGAIDRDTLAAISYTGGTTGRPKGVMQSHGNLVANAKHVLLQNPLRPSARNCILAEELHHALPARIPGSGTRTGVHHGRPRFHVRSRH